MCWWCAGRMLRIRSGWWSFEAAGAEVVRVAGEGGRVDLGAALDCWGRGRCWEFCWSAGRS